MAEAEFKEVIKAFHIWKVLLRRRFRFRISLVSVGPADSFYSFSRTVW